MFCFNLLQNIQKPTEPIHTLNRTVAANGTRKTKIISLLLLLWSPLHFFRFTTISASTVYVCLCVSEDVWDKVVSVVNNNNHTLIQKKLRWKIYFTLFALNLQFLYFYLHVLLNNNCLLEYFLDLFMNLLKIIRIKKLTVRRSHCYFFKNLIVDVS